MDLIRGDIEFMQNPENYDRDNWFSAYVPEEEDG
jgi:hypothetical protein